MANENDVLPQVKEGEEPTPDAGSSLDTSQKQEPSQNEYTKERFDGLMSSWQKDRLELQELKTAVDEIKSRQLQPQVSDEERWFEYIDTKLQERRKIKETAEEESARKELEQITTAYPDLKEEKVLETAIKYKTDLKTAAEVLKDMQGIGDTKTKIVREEEEKKRKAGMVAGSGGVSSPKGLTGYDSKLSLKENIERGKQELGL